MRAAAGGNHRLRAVYDETFEALLERLFAEDAGATMTDTPASRLMVRGWQRLAEELVLGWCENPSGLSRDDLVQSIVASLPALVGVTS